MKWFSLPTWLLYRAFRSRLPPKHPWKNRSFTLADWAAGSTALHHQINFAIWYVLILEAHLIFVLVRGLNG